MARYPYGKQSLIDGLQRELDDVERTWPMTHSYKRIDPYIIPTFLGLSYFEIIIFHEESRLWFDNIYTDTIMDNIYRENLIKPGETAFDIGSNAGVVTLIMARMVGPNGNVHAFDPFPWNALATRYNAKLNYFNNVTSHAVGLSNKRYTINVSPNDSRIYEASQADDSQTLRIEPINEFMYLKPKFLKIDIEGSEHELFMDQHESVFDSVRAFALEFHPFMIRPRGIDPKESLHHIDRSGFTLHYHHHTSSPYDIESFSDDHHLFWGLRKTQLSG